MKTRLLVLALAVCMIATPAMAGLYYQMDVDTAKDMRMIVGSLSTGDSGSLDYVGYNDGQSPFDWVFGTAATYYANSMIYSVGFSGQLSDDNHNNYVSMAIGLASPGLEGDYDGFLLPIANDNDDWWQYRAYVTTTDSVGGTTTYYSNSGAWTDLAKDTFTTLKVDTGNIDFDIVTSIGFGIRWDSVKNDNWSDRFSTSVVPVPGAVILGILGLGAVGIKLRKYA